MIGMAFTTISCNDAYDASYNNPGNMTNKQPAPNEVWMVNISFVPQQKTVTKGTAVTWVNKDNTSHTVTSLDGLFDADVKGGGTFTYTFDSTGTYNYTCSIHADMDGMIIVNENAGGGSGGY